MNEQSWRIAWNDEMSVGIPEIDEDEKHFLHLVDEFNQSVIDRMDISEVRKRLQDIIDDSERHFSNEERLLNGRCYPKLGDHTLKHVELKYLIRHILTDSALYKFDTEWIKAGLDIKEALLMHILTEDMKYAEYYRSKVAGSNGKV
jgi:hemerythrin-like metal-binding protein